MTLLKKPKIAWYIPPILDGSGGLLNMFQKADALERAGFECHLYIEESGVSDIQPLIEKYYGRFELTYFCGFNLKFQYDLIIVTMYYSSFLARDSGQKCPIIYFNQDYEALFHHMGDGFLMGEESHMHIGVPVTSGRWLTHLISVEYGIAGYPVEIGADVTVYHPLPNRKREQAICFIYQPEKFRRCPELGIRALEIVKQRHPGTSFYTFGSKSDLKIDFEHTNFGMLPGGKEINEVYNRCRAGLCISSTNPSRVPFEMIAAGLPMVDVYRYNNLLDMPEKGVFLAYQTSESIAEALIGLLDDDVRWEQASKGGVKVMQRRTLGREHALFVAAVSRVFQGMMPNFVEQPVAYTRPAIVSPPEAERETVRHFCNFQRQLASRPMPVRPRDDEPYYTLASALLRSIVPPKPKDENTINTTAQPNVFYEIGTWEDVPSIGYNTLAALDLSEYELKNGALRYSRISTITVDAYGFNKPLISTEVPHEEQAAVIEMPIELMERAAILATPPEWSGVDSENEFLSLHPNGENPSRADFFCAVPIGTTRVAATIEVAHPNSPPIEFAIGVVMDNGEQASVADSPVVVASPFVRLYKGDVAQLLFCLPTPTTHVNSLRLLTKHPTGERNVINSHARWCNIRFFVKSSTAGA